MKFPLTFLRNTTGTGGIPELGTDAAPTTAYGTPGTGPQPYKANVNNQDCVLMTAEYSRIAVPFRRIAISMCGPSGATTLTATLYVWETTTQHWYALGATSGITLTNNEITLVDIPTIGETPPNAGPGQAQAPVQAQQPGMPTSLSAGRAAGGALSGGPGGAAFMLVVDDSGTPPAGTYQFGMAPSFSANVS
jgi:hypothetical protein